VLPDSRTLVECFYGKVWNRADERVAREILHPEFAFRGSLGPERHGHDEFLDYLRSIHKALAGYRCTINDLITTEARAAARMTFSGTHQGVFFGVPATGRVITWAGAAFFTMAQGRITRLWVIGDVEAVRRLLGAGAGAAAFFL
jgi:steroid delta-isomerase-like uncharacterized protein